MGYYDSYDYMYDYGTTADTAGITIMLIYFGVLLVWGLFALAGYIIKAIGIYTIAKREGAEYPWLAFVPFARTYLQGELGGEVVLKKKSIRNPGIWLLVLPFVTAAVGFVFYMVLFAVIGFSMFSYSTAGYSSSMGAGSVLMIVVLVILFIAVMVVFSAALQVLKVLVNHQILRKFTSKNMSIAHAVLMGVIPLYEPICYLIMSRRPYNPGMEPPEARPFMQAPPEGPNPQMGGPVPPMNGPVPPMHGAPADVDEKPLETEEPKAEGTKPEAGAVPPRGLWNSEGKPDIQPETVEDKRNRSMQDFAKPIRMPGEEEKSEEQQKENE